MYGGDSWYRLFQEIVLGTGGVRRLGALGHDKFPLEMASRALGYSQCTRCHAAFCLEGALNMTYVALNLRRLC